LACAKSPISQRCDVRQAIPALACSPVTLKVRQYSPFRARKLTPMRTPSAPESPASRSDRSRASTPLATSEPPRFWISTGCARCLVNSATQTATTMLAAIVAG
jgi:hypothetical protein